jgi:hypothetical protein
MFVLLLPELSSLCGFADLSPFLLFSVPQTVTPVESVPRITSYGIAFPPDVQLHPLPLAPVAGRHFEDPFTYRTFQL